MQALIAAVLPMLVSALSSVLGKSVSEFNALPRNERPAKLRAVLRSKWMLTSPPAAIAARALAATDAGVNAAVNALEKYGAGAVALGTEAAHAAAEKHLAKNPRSGGRMARVRIAPSIPTYALDRLDVTRARRNGWDDPPFASEAEYRESQRRAQAALAARAYTAAGKLAVKYGGEPGEFGVLSIGHGGAGVAGQRVRFGLALWRLDALPAHLHYAAPNSQGLEAIAAYILANKTPPASENTPRVNGARKNGYSRRRNCGGDCACAPCQAAARSNPDPFAAVRRATEKKVLRYVEEGSSVKGTWGQLVDAAYRVYEKHRIATGEQLPVEAVVAEINAARTRAEGLRSAHNKRATHAAEQAYRDEMRGRAAYMNPATRRNHHIRVGGTFYTPGGRRGTVLAEARGGYYRVRWSDGTVGTVQDNEWAAYPTEGSRANPATVQLPTKVGETVSVSGAGGTLHVTKTKRNEYHAAVSGTRFAPWGPSGSRWGNTQEMQEDIAYWLRMGALPFSGGNVHNPRSNGGAARSNGTETKYYGYRLYFGKPTQNKWAGDFATREQAQEKANEMIGEYGEPSDGIRIVKYRAQLRRK